MDFWVLSVVRGGPGFEVRGRTVLGFSIAPPLRCFPEATKQVYTWIFLGLRFAPPPLSIFLEATMNVYTWIFLRFRIATPFLLKSL